MKSRPTNKPFVSSPEEKAKAVAFFEKKLAALPPLRRKRKKENTNAKGKFRTLTPEKAWAIGAGKRS